MIVGDRVMKRDNFEAIVHIIGNNSFINQVIINLIQDRLGYLCTDFRDLDELQTTSVAKNDLSQELILWDCQTTPINGLWNAMGDEDDFLAEIYKVAVFNVPTESDIGLNILKHGGHGIFYQKDSPEIFIKGVKALVDGELWIPRELANKYIYKTRNRKKENRDGVLTNREKEILICLPSGNTNEDIADTLHISPHTVRTHLSNIYGKLHVNNRFQAALWASENLY